MRVRKGVSPVVAEVLLMGIAISAAVSAGVFLRGTMDDLKDNVNDRLSREEMRERASIGVEAGYNGTDGYLLVDVRNTGSVTLAVEEESEKLWNMYLEGVPASWSYVRGSPYIGQENVFVDPSSTVTLNTTRVFPAVGNSVSVEVTGTYGTQSTFVCFSQNGGCES